MFDLKNIVDFIKKSKLSIIIIVFFILLTFGQRLLSNSISMDTEYYIRSYQTTYNAFLSLGRPSLLGINEIFGFSKLIPFVSVFLTLILMLVYSILINYLFYISMKGKYKKVFLKYQFILPIIFISSPIFAEQYNFIFQSVGVALGITLVPVSLLLVDYALKAEKRLNRVIYSVSAILLAAFAFGTYQSVIFLYILIVVSVYFIKTYFSRKNYFEYLFISITTFIFSFAFYFLISNTLKTEDNYLQYCWLKQGLDVCTKNISYVITEMVTCNWIFYNTSYLIALLLLVILVIYKLFRRNFSFGFLISSIGLLLGPLYIMLITGVDQLYRTQFNYPFFIGFVFLMFVTSISSYEKKVVKIVLSTLITCVALFIGYKQAYMSAELFYSDTVRYQGDITVANKIQSSIESKDWYNNNESYVLVLLGNYRVKPINFMLYGEVMGHSFFEFDYPYWYGPSRRANTFMRTLGYYYKYPRESEFQEAKEFVVENNIPSFPSKDSINKLGNMIVVKLSDQLD